MKRIAVLMLLCATLPLTGCNREGELRGDVFIVTQGAQNFKLGLVEVRAIPDADMKNFLAARAISAEPEIAKRQKEYDTIKQQYDSATANYSDARNETEDARKALDEGTTSDSAGQQFRNALQARDKLERESDKLKTVSDIKPKLDAAESNLREAISPVPFFVDMPKGIATATTDADGKFLIKLPISGKFALVAHASRQAIGVKEEYYWIVWTSLEGQSSRQVMLSNNNLLQSGADIKAQAQ